MMQVLQFKNLTDNEKTLVKNFVLQWESACIRLCELIKKESADIFAVFDDQQCKAVIGNEKIITHCIPSPCDEIARLISPLFNTDETFSINGDKTGTDFIAGILAAKGKAIAYRYDYILMEKREGIFDKSYTALSGGEEIVPCAFTIDSLESLKTLQKDYLNIEVARPDHTVSDSYVQATLHQNLKSQIVLAVEVDGTPQAKANTSGSGWNFVQIGGVYTSPQFRRYGFARALVATLCNRILRSGKYASLFVKEKNTAALNLYESMGFSKVGLWSIAYY